MHPAYSVILFTTASGAGYGLLIWLCLLGGFGFVRADFWLGLIGFGLALGLISVGLLSSMLHLGRPERAWRAFSQWRSSWLSREGVAAVVTFVPAGLTAISWLWYSMTHPVCLMLALVTVVCAAVTVYCTGKIYASLRTIRQWHHPLVVPVYLALALATGAVLMQVLIELFGVDLAGFRWITILTLLIALGLKSAYWSSIDRGVKKYTVEQATGLGHIGKVRPLEAAHSQPNFVMREMGYSVGRKHAAKLRMIATTVGLMLPVVLLIVAMALGGPLAIVGALLALVATAVGVAVERWLFFAEAQHVVTLFYGADAA